MFFKKNNSAGKSDPTTQSRDYLHQYWRTVEDDANAPHLYLGEKESQKLRSVFLVELVRQFVSEEAHILELGCNVGRNLDYLYRNGYSQLAGIEINNQAVDIFRTEFPATAEATTIHVGPIESVVTQIPDNSFDVVFTMAVLEHIHTESEFIFTEMSRIAKIIITIEDERTKSIRHFPRDYKQVFEAIGLRQEFEHRMRLDTDGLGGNFFARVFKNQN